MGRVLGANQHTFVVRWFKKKNGIENRHEKTDKTNITDLPLRAVVISAYDTLMTYTALFKDGTRKHKRRKNIPWNKTNSGVLPLFDPTSKYPLHSSELTEYRTSNLILLRYVVFISRNAVLSFYLVNFGVQG